MTCKIYEEWRKEAEYWKRENQRNKEVARELSLELDSLRENFEGGNREPQKGGNMKDINELIRDYERIEESRYNDKLEREEYDEWLLKDLRRRLKDARDT